LFAPVINEPHTAHYSPQKFGWGEEDDDDGKASFALDDLRLIAFDCV
jgi:hypothetical protein